MEEDIKKCIDVLQNGGTILYPTDTIWGIGCDATNSDAVEKIYIIKNRPENKRFVILLDDFEKLKFYLEHVPDKANDFISSYDKPLTIIFPGAKNLAKNVISNDGSIGIRIVRDDFCKKLIHTFGKPIVSSSANISGKEAPLFFPDISGEIVIKVDFVVKFNQDKKTNFKPSTIIKLTENGNFITIRE